MTTHDPSKAAGIIARSRLAAERMETLPAGVAPATLEQGYAVQDAVHELLADTLGPVVGHKIGCTTPVMQTTIGIDHACAGGVLENTVAHMHVDKRKSDFVRVGVECEIAMILGGNLDGPTPFTAERVADAIAAIAAAMEIVDDRYADFQTFGTPSLVADDFFSAGCVLGDAIEDWRGIDLEKVEGTALIAGEEAAQGRGADVMGHPLNALAWLASLMAERGTPLKAGAFVLTGSLTKVQFLDAPAATACDLGPLGRVTANFS